MRRPHSKESERPALVRSTSGWRRQQPLMGGSKTHSLHPVPGSACLRTPARHRPTLESTGRDEPSTERLPGGSVSPACTCVALTMDTWLCKPRWLSLLLWAL